MIRNKMHLLRYHVQGLKHAWPGQNHTGKRRDPGDGRILETVGAGLPLCSHPHILIVQSLSLGLLLPFQGH